MNTSAETKHKNFNMRSVSILVLLTATQLSEAFAPTSSKSVDTKLYNFLDGSQKKNDIMTREDDAMWVDDDDQGVNWNPFAAKKAPPMPKASTPPPPPPAAKKAPAASPFSFFAKKSTPEPEPVPEPVEPPERAGGFKFPWDK